MGKDKDGKRKDSKRGKANDDAWEAARKAAKADAKEHKEDKWSKDLWREIRDQLRRTGNVVDLTAVPIHWTDESPQMNRLRDILQEAGFHQDEHQYYWKE